MRRVVVDLDDARPVFAIPERVVAAIRGALPAGWEVRVVQAPAQGTGDGGATASPEALDAVRDAEVYLGYGLPGALLQAAPGLRWAHTGAAGVGAALTPELLERDVLFTNSAGIHGPPVAETVLSYILHFARGLDLALTAQRARRWDKAAFDAADTPVRELGRSTVGIVGLGGIGREVAWRAAALGARVVGTRRRPVPVDGVELLTGDDALGRLLESSDYVVLTVPETGRTRGLIGRAELERMRRGAVLINVARGGLLDEDALATALVDGRIRGAALDVFAAEPLPADHPLRDAPNLLITPHTSAYTHHFWEREGELILGNLRRYLRGESLRNMVDKREGY
jgi:phosphoglycerate dehydrogenase-like enzyme